jgi:hypothetical protein
MSTHSIDFQGGHDTESVGTFGESGTDDRIAFILSLVILTPDSGTIH